MRKAFTSIAVLLCLVLTLQADTSPAFFSDDYCAGLLTDTIDDRYDIEALEFVANDMSQKLNGVMLVAVRDTVLVEHAYGELRLTGEPPHRDVPENNRITETGLPDNPLPG